MTGEHLVNSLLPLRDEAYQAFQSRLIPEIPSETILGVRTPELRRIAREAEQTETFLKELPHKYFEENQVHAFLIERCRDFDAAIDLLTDFLPWINNWATCDQLNPKVLGKDKKKLLSYISLWLTSGHVYTVRFAMGCVQRHFLDSDFSPEYLSMAAKINREEYYIRMMQAWLFATALAKQYRNTLPYLTENKLPQWVHNKTIQKAVESYRITPEQKEYLRTLRRK